MNYSIYLTTFTFVLLLTVFTLLVRRFIKNSLKYEFDNILHITFDFALIIFIGYYGYNITISMLNLINN